MSLIANLIDLSLEAAPWLVLGLALGGLMKSSISSKFLKQHLKGNGVTSIFKATILGAPLPLCSCGVIPAAMSLRKAGASKPSTAAFLVSTPETGIDSISVTYALLGPFMALIRPIAAVFSALTVGMLVAWFDNKPVALTTTQNETGSQSDACCSKSTKSNGCGSGTTSLGVNTINLGQIWQDIQSTFTDILDEIGAWLLGGLIFAAIAQTYLSADFLASWGQGFPAMLVMLLAGIPMYICATSSTPIAAGLILAGVSPGVALVLLLTGPATNISTLGVIAQQLGRRSMWLYLMGVAGTAITSGWLLDTLINSYHINIIAQIEHTHAGIPLWLAWACLLLLLAVALRQPLKTTLLKTQANS